MTTPVPGDPAAVLRTAETLDDAARRWDEARAAVLSRAGALADAWPGGVAGGLAVARVRHDAELAGRAGDACRSVVAPLRAFAEELRRAQQDWAEGAAMVAAGRAASAGIGSAAPLEGPRDEASESIDDGTSVMESAADRARAANEDAARALRAATAELAALIPPGTTPQADGGSFWTGLAKAGEDVVGGIGSVLGGTADRLNPFSDRFGPAWTRTWQQVSRPMDDPWTELAAAADAAVAPVRESYRNGGVDEALGRSFGVIGEALAGKGLDKIGTLAKAGELGTTATADEVGGAGPPPLPPPDPNPGFRSAAERGPLTPLVPGGGLQQHENAGGHTLATNSRHVGASDDQLLQRQQETKWRLPGTSTYTSHEVAGRAISDSIAAHRAEIDEWLAGQGRRYVVHFDHGEPVGRFAAWGAGLDEVVPATESTTVLLRDPALPTGYRVLTSYLDP